eukprot:scaffold16780_cov63-Phaeocystis_antarctica.AAC.3
MVVVVRWPAVLLWASSSRAFVLPAVAPAGGCHMSLSVGDGDTQTATRCRAFATEEKPPSTVNVGALVGYTLLLAYLSPVFARAAANGGLWNPPPVDLFSEIAYNAADEALAAGTLQLGTVFGYPVQGGTFFAQGIWKDLLAEFYANGETTDFLTKAGGICAQHAAWCEGVSILPGST